MFAEDFVPIQPSLDEMYGYTGTLDGDAMTSFNSGWAHDGNGGYYFPEWPDGSDDGVIVVPGSLPGIQVYLDDLLDLGLTWKDLYPGGTVPQPDGGDPDDGTDTTEDEQDNQCPDGEALVAEAKIEAKDDDSNREYLSFTYVDSGGVAQHSEPTPGDSNRITADDVQAHLQALWDRGIDLGTISGITHNHPIEQMENADHAAINRYPSEDDWVMAQSVADLIAVAGGDPSDLSLYVLGPDGVLREFKLADRGQIEDLTTQEKINGADLPEGVQSCGN